MPSLPGPSGAPSPRSSGSGSSTGSSGSSRQGNSQETRHTDRDLERAVNEAIKRTEATLKRKIKDIYQCTICLSVAREGHIVQCQNGHLFCEGCLDHSNRDSCPTCATPLNRLEGNNKIRALGIEQLIEAVDLDFQCKHADCQVVMPKRELGTHEKKCKFRLVKCPMSDCKHEISFHGLLRHMSNGQCQSLVRSSYITGGNGDLDQDFFTSQEKYNGNGNINWKIIHLKFHEQSFMIVFARAGGIYYTFMYLYGDNDQAKKYAVTISIGHGTQSGIVHHGKIFPIDMKREDILKENSGVVSFSSVGMGSSFFFDKNYSGEEGKVISVRFQISKAAGQNNPIPKVEHFQLSSLGNC